MSQQSNDDLAKALEGLGQSKPAPSPASQPRPAAKAPQIKIQTAPAKAPVPAARPTQPGANPATSTGKGIPMPRQGVRPVAAPAAPKVTRASSPLDAPPSLAGAVEAKSSAAKALQKPAVRGNTALRTLIPILLTLGFILVILSVVHFQWKSIDNPTMDVSPGVAYAIGALGVVIWGLAALVMASVARQIRTNAADSATPSTSAALTSQKGRSRSAQPD